MRSFLGKLVNALAIVKLGCDIVRPSPGFREEELSPAGLGLKNIGTRLD
jgi:hypothetical protein